MRCTRIVGFWHTRGAPGVTRKLFSDMDTKLANSYGLPMFVADHTGKLKVFEPGDRLMNVFQAKRLGLGTMFGYARGKEIKNSGGDAIRIQTR